MADHFLTRLRQAMQTQLQTIAAGYPVHLGRRDLWPVDQLPAINIKSVEEELEKTTIHGLPLMARRGVLEVEIVAEQDAGDIDPTLFEAQKQIEQVIALDPTLNGAVHDCYLQSSMPEDVEMAEDDSENPISKRVLRFAFYAYASAESPDIIVGSGP